MGGTRRRTGPVLRKLGPARRPRIGTREPPRIELYAAKHGVIGLTRSAALEVATENVRVNAVCPGVIETPMVERVVGDDEAVQEGLLAAEPIGRIGKPEEIASTVVYLCSDDASFVTGHPMVVDGGYVVP
ncbi:3-oxoacyl-ACP reductase [Haloferax mucosum ATCC BAA-1512]|uniref:3-oxoacyl-ACP reductase n=1 Tax=Haloferax mucosum ATCC BAA-1512 TaxID=662479 RepID=M0IQ55_9EURY|nr:SDR family oxidoreductase [Haloferax mucosum]ELZ98966.1 3-oxoacyl-ACP reductase [Haloferax mucosum ATCC BAA-1512]